MKSPPLVSPPHFPTLIAPRSVPPQKGREERTVELSESAARLDRALADALPDLSRSRVQALMGEGAVTRDGEVMGDLSARAAAGVYRILIPAARPADPEGEDIALAVLFEDEHLIVIDKAAGMSAHPAPGSQDGTLVNALIHHCGTSLSGIGGVARPGIVHRLDKNTSGVMVAAKTDAAHRGLSVLFAAHDLERVYIALTRGAPAPPRGEIRTRLGRSTADRKKMAVLRAGGREAITHYTVTALYGTGPRPSARPRVVPAGDGKNAPDPGAPRAQGRAVPRRPGLWLGAARNRPYATRSRRRGCIARRSTRLFWGFVTRSAARRCASRRRRAFRYVEPATGLREALRAALESIAQRGP